MDGAVEQFTALVDDEPVDLGAAALALGRGVYPDLDLAYWSGALDRLADGVGDLTDLRRRLFADLGLRGAGDDYYDPDSSYLHRVLQRRRGIPVSLGVIVIEVGRRAGVVLDGVGMPGHFLVRDRASGALVDPYHEGRVLDDTEAEALFRGAARPGADVTFGPDLLPILGPRAILVRMLANLRSLYRAAGAARDLEWVVRMRLALPGVSAADLAELGEALAAQGRMLEGARELEDRAGDDPDEAETLIAAARALRSRLN